MGGNSALCQEISTFTQLSLTHPASPPNQPAGSSVCSVHAALLHGTQQSRPPPHPRAV